MAAIDTRYWPFFVKYAERNGIGLVYEDDWKFWWDCFYAGIRIGQKIKDNEKPKKKYKK